MHVLNFNTLEVEPRVHYYYAFKMPLSKIKLEINIFEIESEVGKKMMVLRV